MQKIVNDERVKAILEKVAYSRCVSVKYLLAFYNVRLNKKSLVLNRKPGLPEEVCKHHPTDVSKIKWYIYD